MFIATLCMLNSSLTYCQTRYSMISADGACIPINEALDSMSNKEAEQILTNYYASIHIYTDSVIGYCADKLSKDGKESLLGNFASDALIKIGEQIFDSIHVDMGLINKGGIRKNMFQGDITIGNIYGIFPFDNNITIITVKGSIIRELFESFVTNNDYEAYSGAKLLVKNNKIESISINGQPINDNKTYNIATLDYIADGKDHLEMLSKPLMRIDSPIPERYAFISYIKQLTARGEIISSKLDNRLIIK